ncbi:hypothetical protein Mapa_011487 [Marchantia paleacea]|nr:hypothetical protein Mapa_011487 [Marchantia paleacea]
MTPIRYRFKILKKLLGERLTYLSFSRHIHKRNKFVNIILQQVRSEMCINSPKQERVQNLLSLPALN